MIHRSWLLLLSVVFLFSLPAYTLDLNEELLKAAEDGDVAKVQSALARGANVNARDGGGNTPLMIAVVSKGSTAIVKALLAKGADINARNEVSQTALYLAARGGYVEIVDILAAKGADLNSKDVQGKTPLMVAISAGQNRQRQSAAREGCRSKGQG